MANFAALFRRIEKNLDRCGKRLRGRWLDKDASSSVVQNLWTLPDGCRNRGDTGPAIFE